MEFVEDPTSLVGDRAGLRIELVAFGPVLIRPSVRLPPLAFELF
jgi:hypothetical protein